MAKSNAEIRFLEKIRHVILGKKGTTKARRAGLNLFFKNITATILQK